MGIMQLLAIIWARRGIVVGCFIATVALAVGVSLILPKSYEAEVTILIDNDTRSAYTNEFVNRTLISDYLGKQVAIIKSHRAASEVVDKLKLAQNESFRREFLRSTDGKITLEEWIAQRLLKKLRVVPLDRESSVVLLYRSTDADTSATIANAFADAYLETSVSIKAKNAQRTSAQLSEQAVALRKELVQAERELREFQQRTGLVVAEDELDSERQQFEALIKLQIENNSATESASAQLEAFKEAKEDGRSIDELEVVADNQLLRSLRAEIAVMNGDIAQIGRRYSATHPDYKAAVARRSALQREIKIEVNRLERSLEAAVQAGQRKTKELEASIDKQKVKVIELQKFWDEYIVYLNNVKTKRAALEKTNQRAGEEAIESQVSEVNALVLSAAEPPTSAEFPNLFLNAGLAIGFGLFFGLAMAVLVELLNRRIRSADDVEQAAGAPVIVVLPKRANA